MSYAEVRNDSGTPRLYVDGVETPPILYGLSDFPGAAANTAYAQKNIAQFAAAGIHLFQADSDLRLGWHKSSPFEWEPIHEEIAAVVAADPEAKVILRLHLNPPYWWLRDHPEEQVLYDGRPGVDDGEMQRLIRDDEKGRLRASLASTRWLREAGELLRLFCEKEQDTEEGQHVIGIQPACGLFGEWAHFGGGNDTSACMLARFRRMLSDEYGTDAALQAAWGRADVTLADAPFEPDSARGTDGIFRDPVLSRGAIDAQKCLQTVLAEDILYFCRIIKESWHRPVLTGAFYSYINSRHYLMQMLYEHRGTVDYMSGPFPYLKNREPQNVPMQRGLLESNRLRGMLWLTEMDGHPAGTEHFAGGDPVRMDETLSVLRRNVWQPLLGGQGLWYYDHRLIARFVPEDARNPCAGSLYRKTGWWDRPVLMEEIGRMRELAARYIRGAHKKAADVLLVYCPPAGLLQARMVDEEYETVEAVARAGAAYDCIFTHEMDRVDWRDYRCVIFVNLYEADAEARRRIAALPPQLHRVFLYAAGYSDGRTLSAEHIRALTGIRVKQVGRQTGYETPDGARWAIDPCDFDPVFAVEDDAALPLSRYERGGPVSAARRGNTWYFAGPRLDVYTVRKVFEAAGVHCYCGAGAPVLAGEGLVAVYAYGALDSTLTLKNGTRIPLRLSARTTAVFDADTGERLE